MNPARFLRRSISKANQSAQSLLEIRAGIANQSDLINRKLNEVISIMRGEPVPPESNASSEFANRDVRPLERLADYPKTSRDITMKDIEAWRAAESSLKTIKYFADYPANSLFNRIAGAFLYHLVRTMRPQTVVEIGSYYVASSEIMARALWENGTGVIHTTDPFGAERCPVIISQWPEPLQKHIKFYPLNSMSFFEHMEAQNMKIDIAFIDGNHDYEYAYFDLLSAAKMVRPGGIIIMDNIEQCGPFWAAVEFMRANPEWRELGNSIASFSPSRPFDYARFLGEASCAVLQAPKHYVVTSAPRATGQSPYSKGRVDGLRLDIAKPISKGTLHAQVILRGFPQGASPEQLITTLTIAVDGQTSVKAMLDKPLVSALEASITRYTMEIVLFWQTDNANQPLLLNAMPEAFAA